MKKIYVVFVILMLILLVKSIWAVIDYETGKNAGNTVISEINGQCKKSTKRYSVQTGKEIGVVIENISSIVLMAEKAALLKRIDEIDAMNIDVLQIEETTLGV